jgi:hypothetical protein
MPSHIPSHESGIPIGICQTDALLTSNFVNTIADAIVSPTCVEPAPKNEKLIDEDKTPQRKNNVVDEAWIADIKRHYPTIDVDDELRKMDAWIALHPGRRKTRKFIVGWLNRCQTELAPQPQKPALRNEDYDFTW